jgi:acyl carrier protein
MKAGTDNHEAMTEGAFSATVLQMMEEQAGTVLERSALMSGLSFDSLDTIEFLYRVEEALGVSISPLGLRRATTVGDVVDMIVSQRR